MHYNRVKPAHIIARRAIIIVLVQSWLVATLLLLYLVSPYQDIYSDAQQLIHTASIFVIGLFIWSFWSWRALTKSLFDPYGLFLLSALLFNGGHAFLEILGVNRYGLLYNSFSYTITLQTLHLVALGVASFHWGALISVLMSRAPLSPKGVASEADQGTPRSIRLVGWGLLAISIIPAILLLRDTALFVMSHGYFELYQRNKPIGFDAAPAILARFLVPAALFILAGSKKHRANIVASGIIVLSYALIYLFIGKRGEALMALVAYTWLWHKTIRPLPMITILSAAMVGLLVVIPVVQVTRQLPGTERLEASFLIDAFVGLENPVISALGETGNTMLTVAYTLKLVPAYRNFDMGLGYLYSFLSILPNLFWSVHPTTAHAYNWWLNWIVNPTLAAKGGGLGFSFIAEAYLNFGWLGMPLALGLIGFLLVKFVLWAENSHDPAKFAMVASFLASFLMYARGEFGPLPRFFVWYALIPYMGIKIVAATSRRYRAGGEALANRGQVVDMPQK